MNTLSASQVAQRLKIDVSRVVLLCRAGRLGYSLPKSGRAWVITEEELAQYLALGPKKSGRPRKPRKLRLLRAEKDGNHVYG